MKSERVQWIDIAKGIGIILVTIGHTRLSGTVVGMWLTQFHMPLFFMMAGLCFDEFRYAKYGDYVKRKIVALGYPYLMLSFVAAAVYSVLCFNPKVTVVGLAIDTLRGQSVGPLWFVSALFFVELIFGALCKVCKNGGGGEQFA